MISSVQQSQIPFLQGFFRLFLTKFNQKYLNFLGNFLYNEFVRKILIIAVLLFGLIFAITRFTEMEKIASTLYAGDWRFVLLAVICEIAWLWLIGRMYYSIYHMLGMEVEQNHMVSLASAANFVSVVAPSGGMSSIAVFIADARQRGYPTARVTIANVIYILCEYLGVLGAFALGVVVLMRRNSMNLPAMIAAAALTGMVVVIFTLLLLAMRTPRLFGRVLGWLARGLNFITQPFIRREYLSLETVQQFAREAAESIALVRARSPWRVSRPVLLSITNKFVLMLILALIFMAFRVPFSIGTLVASFSISYLFVVVSPTPAGIGIVEGILTLWLRTLGVPLEPAAVIALAFRGVTFWQPLFIGGFMFRQVGKPFSQREGIN